MSKTKTYSLEKSVFHGFVPVGGCMVVVLKRLYPLVITSMVLCSGSGLTTEVTALETSHWSAGAGRPGFSVWCTAPLGARGVICWPMLGSGWGCCARTSAPDAANASVRRATENGKRLWTTFII